MISVNNDFLRYIGGGAIFIALALFFWGKRTENKTSQIQFYFLSCLLGINSILMLVRGNIVAVSIFSLSYWVMLHVTFWNTKHIRDMLSVIVLICIVLIPLLFPLGFLLLTFDKNLQCSMLIIAISGIVYGPFILILLMKLKVLPVNQVVTTEKKEKKQ